MPPGPSNRKEDSSMEKPTFSAIEEFGLNADIGSQLTKVDYETVVSGLREQGYFWLNAGDAVNIIASTVDPKPQVRFPRVSHKLGVLPIYESVQVAPIRFTTDDSTEDIPVRLAPSSDYLRRLGEELSILHPKLSSFLTPPEKSIEELSELQKPIDLVLEAERRRIKAEQANLAQKFLGIEQYAPVLAAKGIMLDQIVGVTLDAMFPKGTIIERNDL